MEQAIGGQQGWGKNSDTILNVSLHRCLYRGLGGVHESVCVGTRVACVCVYNVCVYTHESQEQVTDIEGHPTQPHTDRGGIL